MVEQAPSMLELVVKIMDIRLEKDKRSDKVYSEQQQNQMDLYLFVGEEEQGRLNINSTSTSNCTAIPLDAITSENKLKLVLQITHKQMVSISFTQETILNAPDGITDQWITFYYAIEDDEYDGILGGDPDDEDPAVRLLFLVQKIKQEDQSIQRPESEDNLTQHQQPTKTLDEIYQQEAILMSLYPERFMINVNGKMEPLKF